MKEKKYYSSFQMMERLRKERKTVHPFSSKIGSINRSIKIEADKIDESKRRRQPQTVRDLSKMVFVR